MDPIFTCKSHIQGKNATVALFPDRIEWSRKGWIGAASKATLGVVTMGASLLATGIRRSEDGEIIPMTSISHVGKKRGKGLNTEVVLTTAGGDVYMRVHHNDADRLIDMILRLQRGETVTPVQPVQLPADEAPIVDRARGAFRDLSAGVQQAVGNGQAEPAPSQPTAPAYGQAPADYGQAPSGYGQAPADYGEVPSGYGQVPAQAPQPTADPQPAGDATDVMAQIKKLGELRDAGVLTEEEFAAKKAELLARL